MEQNGHLECWLDETDKRNKIVALTQQAKSLGVIHGFPIGIQLIKLTTDKPTSKKIIIVSGSPITDAIFESKKAK